MHLAGNQIAACQSNLRNLLSSLLLYCGNLSHWHPLIWRLMGLCTKLLPAHTYIYKHIRTCIYYVYMFAIFKRKKKQPLQILLVRYNIYKCKHQSRKQNNKWRKTPQSSTCCRVKQINEPNLLNDQPPLSTSVARFFLQYSWDFENF